MPKLAYTGKWLCARPCLTRGGAVVHPPCAGSLRTSSRTEIGRAPMAYRYHHGECAESHTHVGHAEMEEEEEEEEDKEKEEEEEEEDKEDKEDEEEEKEEE